MKLSSHSYFLEFIHPFVLAHGTRNGTNLVFVKIEHKGFIGYGEASLPPYRKETKKSVTNWIESQRGLIEKILEKNPFEIESEIPFSEDNPAASSALQGAILNWYSTSNDKKLAHFFDIKNESPSLTLTVTKNEFKTISEKLKVARNFSHLKLKLTGDSDDFEFVKGLRGLTTLPFCVDFNQGVKNKEIAIRTINELEKLQCVLIEQPLNAHNHEDHYWLKKRTELPIIADESICFYSDLKNYYEAYSGINVKLIKCGGLFQAKKMIDFILNVNNSFKSELMPIIGCMSESSLGVSMASILSSKCKMADLDAPYLNKNDPFQGFSIVDRKIIIEDIQLKNEFGT